MVIVRHPDGSMIQYNNANHVTHDAFSNTWRLWNGLTEVAIVPDGKDYIFEYEKACIHAPGTLEAEAALKTVVERIRMYGINQSGYLARLKRELNGYSISKRKFVRG